MKRRDFMRFTASGMLSLTGFGLAGCEEYATRSTYGVDVYYYYRDSNVYYYPYSRIYIYIINGRWTRSGKPPPRFVSDPTLRVRIIDRTGTPYARNSQHRQMFSKSGPARDTRPKPSDQSGDTTRRSSGSVKQSTPETRKPSPRPQPEKPVKPEPRPTMKKPATPQPRPTEKKPVKPGGQKSKEEQSQRWKDLTRM